MFRICLAICFAILLGLALVNRMPWEAHVGASGGSAASHGSSERPGSLAVEPPGSVLAAKSKIVRFRFTAVDREVQIVREYRASDPEPDAGEPPLVRAEDGHRLVVEDLPAGVYDLVLELTDAETGSVEPEYRLERRVTIRGGERTDLSSP